MSAETDLDHRSLSVNGVGSYLYVGLCSSSCTLSDWSWIASVRDTQTLWNTTQYWLAVRAANQYTHMQVDPARVELTIWIYQEWPILATPACDIIII